MIRQLGDDVRGCMEIFALKTFLESFIEKRIDLFFAFMDVEKVYDKIY